MKNITVFVFAAVLLVSPAFGENAPEHAADPPLIAAVLNGDSAEVKRLLDGGANPDQADGEGFTALMHAAGRGNAETVNILIGGGAKPDLTDNGGRTALMHAAAILHWNTAKALLDGGADKNARDNDGKTATGYAWDGFWKIFGL